MDLRGGISLPLETESASHIDGGQVPKEFQQLAKATSRVPRQRQTEDISVIRKTVGKLCPTIASLAPEVQCDVARELDYIRRPQGGVLIRQGGDPLFFYILLSGTLSVWEHATVALPGEEDGSPRRLRDVSPSISPRRHQTPRRGGASSRHDKGTPSRAQVKFATAARAAQATSRARGMAIQTAAEVLENSEAATKVAEIVSPGSTVGEDAMVRGAKRSHSVVCDTDCDLVVLPKDEFDRSLKGVFVKRVEGQTKFLREHVPGFERSGKGPTLSDSQVHSIAIQWFADFPSSRHETLVHAGTMAPRLLIVQSGRAAAVLHRPSARTAAGDAPPAKFADVIEYGPGSMIGGQSVMFRQPEEFTVVVRSQRLSAIALKAQDFEHLPRNVAAPMSAAFKKVWDFQRQRVGRSKKFWSTADAAATPKDEPGSRPSSACYALCTTEELARLARPGSAHKIRAASLATSGESPTPSRWASTDLTGMMTSNYGQLLLSANRSWSQVGLRSRSESIERGRASSQDSQRPKDRSQSPESDTSTDSRPPTTRPPPQPPSATRSVAHSAVGMDSTESPELMDSCGVASGGYFPAATNHDTIIGLWRSSYLRDRALLRGPSKLRGATKHDPEVLVDTANQVSFLGVLHDLSRGPMPPLQVMRLPPAGMMREVAQRGGICAKRAAQKVEEAQRMAHAKEKAEGQMTRRSTPRSPRKKPNTDVDIIQLQLMTRRKRPAQWLSRGEVDAWKF